jgi:hypothetical protein
VEYKDIPTKADIERIASLREPGCVSIYLPTGTTPPEADKARIELKNHLALAIKSLEALGLSRARIAAVHAEGESILEDREFWRHQSRSLAVFLNGEVAQTFRLPNRLTSACEVADRFFIKPLLRAVTFPQSALILALAQNSVRLIRIDPEAPPALMEVEGMPKDLATVIGNTSIDGRAAAGRIQGGEGQKVRMLEYVQAIERALHPLLAGSSEPLILAAAEPLIGIFRGASDYPRLVEDVIQGNPEEKSEEELATAARGVLDRLYAAKIDTLKEDFASRIAAGTALVDLSDIARAATYGAVETLVFDIDHRLAGTLDDETGAITYADGDATGDYGVVDEIIRRSLASKAKIYALRSEDVPGGGPVAAAVRFPV